MLKEKYIEINCPITTDKLTILLLTTNNIDPDKKTLVFLHGIGSNTDHYTDILEKIYLLNNIQIIAINMVGNGYSSEIPKIVMDLCNIDLLNYFVKILDLVFLKLNFQNSYENIHLIGHSFGAFLAAHYTKFHTFYKLSLMAPIGIFETTTNYAYYGFLIFKLGLVDLLYKFYNLLNLKFKYKNNVFVNKFISFDTFGTKSYWNITQFNHLNNLNIPIQLIYGYNDYIIPIHQSFLIYSLRKKNKLVTKLNIILHTSHSVISLKKINEIKEYKTSFNIDQVSTNIYNRYLSDSYCKLAEDICIYYDDSHIKHLFN
jgi:pimeloyl-ACP methyl ester carboxylesterase